MKQWIILFVIALITIKAVSQTKKAQVKGRVYNSLSKEYLSAASITVLVAKDSSRAALVFTQRNGTFVINELNIGNYYLFITYLGYQGLLLPVNMKGDISIVDLGDIGLEKKSLSLSTIDIVGSRAPLRMVKDTIEFNASNFRIRPNSTLDELLRRIPGVQVDNDGTIRMNGEVVKNLLVDGRPIFADDPRLIAKNLQADIVDKVQLVDRKVKERDFTELNEALTEKAINITVRKNRQNQWTGQAMGGYGSDEHFSAKLNLAKFNDREQIVMLASGDNINANQDGYVGNNGGRLRRWSPNISYVVDFNDRVTLNSSYRMEDRKLENEQISSRRNFINDTSYYYNQQADEINNLTSHFINNRITYKIDSLSTLGYSSIINFSSDRSDVASIHATLNNRLQVIDSGSLYSLRNSNSIAIGNSIYFERKFLKKGRTISGHFSYSKSNSSGHLLNRSRTLYEKPEGIYLADTINQQAQINNDGKSLQYMIGYVEPVFKEHMIVFSYGFNRNTRPLQRSVYDYNKLNGSYDLVNDSLSSYFKSSMENHFATIGIQTKKEKYDYSFSLVTRFNMLSSTDFKLQKSKVLKSILCLPIVTFNCAFTNYKRISFYYSANQILPSSEQLQPIPDNSNPLLVNRGNPDLKPGIDHGFMLSYSSFSTSSLRFFSIGLTGAVKRNQIINGIWIDSLKRQIIQPINMKGAYSFRLNVDNNLPVEGKKSAIRINTSISIARDMNFVDGVVGSSMITSVTQNAGYDISHGSFFNFSISMSISYIKNLYSNQDFNTSYFSLGTLVDGYLNLPFNIIIGSNLSYLLTNGSREEYNTNLIKINCHLSKAVLKKKGLIKLEGIDLLNQNVSINRVIGPSYIEDSRSNRVQRFFMLGFTYFLK